MKKIKEMRKLFFFMIVLFFLASDAIAQKIETKSLDTFIEKLLIDYDIPGLSVGIVQNDSILFTKGYGIREVNKSETVNKNTLFGIGSISKSFTALLLGILVDEGKVDWDDKVVKYLPYFKLYNPYVTENFTIRDLLTHRSGLNKVSGGILWYHSNYSRTDIIKRLKFLKPVSGFRYTPAYQNVTFLVAGEIVREVSGMAWDKFLKIKVFDRLNMKNSTSVSSIREQSKNIARPHIWDENYQKKIVIPQEKGDNISPAGFIFSSAKEMSNYMRMLLNNGVFEKDTIISEKVINEIFKPQFHFQVLPAPFNNEFTSYGLGWWLTPKNGHKIIEHSGGIDGMASNLVMVKDKNIGVVVLINTDEMASFALTSKILDHIVNYQADKGYMMLKSLRDSKIKKEKNAILTENKSRVLETKPSLKLTSYTGTYTDKMYGDINIHLQKKGNLEISFSKTPFLTGSLSHWNYDTFRVDWGDVRIKNGFITFEFNSKGQIAGFKIDQPNLLDVDFTELKIIKKDVTKE